MLTQAQQDYVIARTNERGAANKPAVSHLGSSEIYDANMNVRYLNIVGVQTDNPEIIHGYTRRDNMGGLGQPDVTDAFKDLVDKTIDGMLRHF